MGSGGITKFIEDRVFFNGALKCTRDRRSGESMLTLKKVRKESEVDHFSMVG